ncbi:MAG TPA: hypothetical protein VGX96_04750 [Candidatus Elarobacter sp.]|nr:hypothetical protein [Candidatus Elarobacter sp.]
MDRALSLLHGDDECRATILRARCLLRLGRVREASAELRDISLEDGDTMDRAEVNVLSASAAARVEQPDLEDAFRDAEVAVEELGPKSILGAELIYIKARTAWTGGILDLAEAFANEVLHLEHEGASSTLDIYHIRALAFELLGLIASDRERFDIAAVCFREALSEVDSAPFRDEWITAFITANVAMLARDFPWSADTAFLSDRIDRVRWISPIASRQYYSLHGIGWCYAHEGNHIGALRAFRNAAEIAPSVPLRIAAWVDHALLGRELGSAILAEESARYAADLAASVDWTAINDAERFALLFLAEVLSEVDVPLARLALKRYEDTRSAFDAAASLHANPANVRSHAFEQRAEAVVARAEGLIPRAHALFRQEYEAWRRIGSEPRAAVAALDAYELDGDPALLQFARRAAASTPLSWVARRVARFD